MTLGLAHFGDPCSLCICGRGGTPPSWCPDPRSSSSLNPSGGGFPVGLDLKTKCSSSQRPHEAMLGRDFKASAQPRRTGVHGCSETIKTSPREWRCRPCVLGILRARPLPSQHHCSWEEDGCCQNRQAVCTRTALSSLPWGPRHLSNQNRKTCDLIFPETQPLLFIKPSSLFHIFLTRPCSDSRLDIV